MYRYKLFNKGIYVRTFDNRLTAIDYAEKRNMKDYTIIAFDAEFLN